MGIFRTHLTNNPNNPITLMKKRLFIFVVLLASILGALPLYAQESCYAEYLREHNMSVLTAEDADDSYDELKKAVLAWQLYGSEASLPLRPKEEPAAPKQQDTTCVIVHLALVDSTWYMWMSVDPLADKYPNVTPYLYCNGNPVMLIDLSGEEPTDEEAAWMAEYAYGDDAQKAAILKSKLNNAGWSLSEFGTTIKQIDSNNGFQSALFERTQNGITEYAYAFAGTNPMSVQDVLADVGQLWGLSSQYSMAIDNAKTLAHELGSSELTFVGHSLGGGEATAASLATGKLAITFNPASVSFHTIVREGLFSPYPNVRNNVVIGDPLTLAQILGNHILMRSFNTRLLVLPGSTKFVIPKSINTHSLQNFIK